MTPFEKDLVDGYFDDALSEQQEAELGRLLKENPAAARDFVEAVRLHDALRNAVRLAHPIESGARPAHARSGRGGRWLVGAGVSSMAAAVLLTLWWWLPDSTSAARELDRLIQAPSVSQDRTYRIASLDVEPEVVKDRQAPLDGATLHVRSPDKYVLVRRFADGRLYVTGFDGAKNWSAPPDGAVRLSSEPERFRGPLPGHQHGIPFANLRSDLAGLRDAYDLRTLPESDNGWKRLLAERKSADFRGPRRVEIWYDGSGVLHRMIFDGLPRARGGPRSVAVELVDQTPLPADFFEHSSHHAKDRRVIIED